MVKAATPPASADRPGMPRARRCGRALANCECSLTAGPGLSESCESMGPRLGCCVKYGWTCRQTRGESASAYPIPGLALTRAESWPVVSSPLAEPSRARAEGSVLHGPAFELLESKLRAPQRSRRHRAAHGADRSAGGVGRGPGRFAVRRPRLGEDDAAGSVAHALAATVRVGVGRRERQRPDRPADLRRGRARPRRAARRERVRRAGVAGHLGRGNGGPAPRGGPGDDGRGGRPGPR